MTGVSRIPSPDQNFSVNQCIISLKSRVTWTKGNPIKGRPAGKGPEASAETVDVPTRHQRGTCPACQEFGPAELFAYKNDILWTQFEHTVTDTRVHSRCPLASTLSR